MAYQSSWPEILAFRLNRHHLQGRNDPDPVTICRDICGVQAQLQSAAEMAFAARNRALTADDIRSALWKNRRLVKTSCMRQTLHLIPAEDFSVYINALKKSRVEALLKIMARFDLGRKEYDKLNRYVEEAVGSQPVVRQKITEKIRGGITGNLEEYIEKAWEIQLYRPALVEGLICYGPREGNQVTYVRADEWLPENSEIGTKTAKRELLKRYLKAYGPAAPKDFSKWAGMPISEVNGIWQSVRDALSEVKVNERTLFILDEDLDPLSRSRFEERVVNLLPGFDAYLLGHAETDHMVSPEHYKKVYRNQGWISHAVLLNGRVIGVWSFDRAKSKISVEPFNPVPVKLKKKIKEEAEKMGFFLNRSLELEFS